MILFAIDIDGVARPDHKPNDYKVDPACVHRINQALRHFDAQVIITSNWRLAFDRSFFNKLFEDRVIAITPDPDDARPENRWHEIQAVLTDMPQPLALVILDDRPDLFPSGLPYLHICQSEIGFSESDLQHLLSNVTPPTFPSSLSMPRSIAMSEDAKKVSNETDLDELVTLEVTLPRRELNRLTHATVQGDYVKAVRWACYESIKTTRNMRDFVEEAPFSEDALD